MRETATDKAVAEAKACRTAMVPPSILAIDLSYHRDPRELQSRAQSIRMAEHFDSNKFDYPVVSYRDGILWVVDGGRRVLTALLCGIKTFPVRIIHGLTRDDEAALFETQNQNQIPVKPLHRYLAKLVDKDELAICVECICKEFGLVMTDKGGDIERPLRAVATVMGIAETVSPYALTWVLTAMDLSHWFDDRTYLMRALSGTYLRAFSSVYVESVRANRKNAWLCNLVNELRKLSPTIVEAYGRITYPLTTLQGCLTVTLKRIAKGDLDAEEILKSIRD